MSAIELKVTPYFFKILLTFFLCFVKRKDLTSFYEKLSKNHSEVCTDYICDPTYSHINNSIKKVWGDRIIEVNTFDLLDWNNR